VAAEAADAAAYERDRERFRSAREHWPLTLLALLAAALLPAAAIAGAVWWLYGRETSTGYDREYEQEPPSDLPPALVPSLLAQGTSAGAFEFTATLFDLIRRGRYAAAPVTTEKRTWGGLRSEQVADLELSGGKGLELEPFEEAVADVADGVLAGESERLSLFRDRITEDRVEQSKRFERFKKGVGSAVRARGWMMPDGLKVLLAGAGVLAATGAVLLVLSIPHLQLYATRWRDAVLLAFGICALVGAVLVLASLPFVRLWRRLRPDARLEAQRWAAFRRYLNDFPRLDLAPPASLELWERLLVYGIAFGLAEQVLRAAQLHMPEELHDASSVYWISPTGDLGSGPSALGIGDLSSGFGSALAPPSSGSGGGGGGFSGGGGRFGLPHRVEGAGRHELAAAQHDRGVTDVEGGVQGGLGAREAKHPAALLGRPGVEPEMRLHDDAERADPGGGEVEQHRRAQTAGADHQNARSLEPGLAGAAYLAQHDVARIAFQFLRIEHFG